MKKYILPLFIVSGLFSCRQNTETPQVPDTQNAKIVSFSISEFSPGDAEIDTVNKTISFTVPPGVDATHLTPTITYGNNATTSQPASGEPLDFTSTQNYQVTYANERVMYLAKANFIDIGTKSEPKAPLALCIYYGYPSLINGSAGNITAATTQFSKFDLIVFGNRIDDASHPEHSKTIDIIRNLSGKKIYGYVSVQGISETEFINKILAWQTMGVTGIFLDNFDVLSRTVQNKYIDNVHNKSMFCFANGSASAVLGGSSTETKLAAGDYFLLESFMLSHGTYTEASEWKTNADLAYKIMRTKKIGVAAVASMADNTPLYDASSNTSTAFAYAWCAAAMYNFDAFQYTEGNYSASFSNVYYFPNYKTSYGTIWLDKDWIKKESDYIYSRSTSSKKIMINTSTHIGTAE